MVDDGELHRQAAHVARHGEGTFRFGFLSQPHPRSLQPFKEAKGHAPGQKAQRKPRTLEIKALATLGLEPNSTGDKIKARYKELVKQHHPDANGGDRGSEERFRDVIQAYQLLKQAGFAKACLGLKGRLWGCRRQLRRTFFCRAIAWTQARMPATNYGRGIPSGSPEKHAHG